MTNRQLLQELGIDVQRIHGTAGKVKCPKCSPTAKHKNKTDLSVDIEKGAYNCHNPDCGFKGRVGNKEEYAPKVYEKPVFNNRTSLDKPIVDYWFKRGISQDTLIKMKITNGIEWMPQVYGFHFKAARDAGNNEAESKVIATAAARVNTIQFPYYRNGEIVNVKYRDGHKNFKLYKGSELVFYNLDSLKDSKWCVIVEGEPDCLSYIEAGVVPVISVPNGANLSENNQNLEYLDNCIDWFSDIEKIIIATDNDAAGMRLRDELARRLGYDRCFKVDYGDLKDANEYLQKHNPSQLAETISDDKLVRFPLAGVILAEELYDKIDFILENGLQRGDITGLMPLDELISWVKGQLTVVTGIPNHGKSPFVLMIMIMLAIKCKWKWGIFSPEHHPLEIYLVEIIEMITGKLSKTKKISKDEIEDAKNFINTHLFFINPEDGDYSLDNILGIAGDLVVRYGISGLLLDPWNKLEANQPFGVSETAYISKELDKVIYFNQNRGVHTIIVAHPTKVKKMGTSADALFQVPNLYDIAGSANWFNKPDVGITFYRNYNTKKNEVHVQKMKWKHLGRQGRFDLQYNYENGRFNPTGISWDNSNWLIPREVQTNLFVQNTTSFTIDPTDQLADEDLPF